MQAEAPGLYQELVLAGGQEAARLGSPESQAAWKTVASNSEFPVLERRFIKSTHFDPYFARLLADGIDLTIRDPVFLSIMWSIAVQHGSLSRIIQNDITHQANNEISDEELVRAIYEERSNVDKYFPSMSQSLQQAMMQRCNDATMQRCNDERDMALQLLANPN